MAISSPFAGFLTTILDDIVRGQSSPATRSRSWRLASSVDTYSSRPVLSGIGPSLAVCRQKGPYRCR